MKTLAFILFLLCQITCVFSQIRITNDTKINTYVYGNYKSTPKILLLNNENILFVWTENTRDGFGLGIYGQITDKNLTKIGQDFRINDFGVDDQLGQNIVKTSNGFLIVWTSRTQDLSGTGIYCRSFDNDGNKLGFEKQINTFTSNDQYDPSIAKLKNGNYIVTWTSDGQNVSIYNDIYAQVIDNSCNKLGNEFQVFNTMNNKKRSDVSSLHNGGYVIVCQGNHNGMSNVIMMQIFDEFNNRVNSISIVNSYLSSNARNPKVLSLDNGYYVASWENIQDGSGYGIYIQIYNTNNQKFGTELQVNSNTDSDQKNIYICQVTNGFIVIWNDNLVYGRMFDNYGNTKSKQFDLSNNTMLYKNYGACTQISSNKFAVTWFDDTFSCCNYNIYSNIFDYSIDTIIPPIITQTSTTQPIITHTPPITTTQPIITHTPITTTQSIITQSTTIQPPPITTAQLSALSSSSTTSQSSIVPTPMTSIPTMLLVPMNDTTNYQNSNNVSFTIAEFIGFVIGLILCIAIIVTAMFIIFKKIMMNRKYENNDNANNNKNSVDKL